MGSRNAPNLEVTMKYLWRTLTVIACIAVILWCLVKNIAVWLWEALKKGEYLKHGIKGE